jgi:hypothetical protein
VKFYVVLVADGGRWEFNSRHDCREDAAEVAREFMAMGQAARVVERWDGD